MVNDDGHVGTRTGTKGTRSQKGRHLTRIIISSSGVGETFCPSWNRVEGGCRLVKDGSDTGLGQERVVILGREEEVEKERSRWEGFLLCFLPFV